MTPVELPNEEAKTAAEKQAREEIKRQRQATENFKKQYFDYYDDVKIGHREDW
ncbi:MAG: hypothetical protein RSB09_02710 [Clostridia bacterium]